MLVWLLSLINLPKLSLRNKHSPPKPLAPPGGVCPKVDSGGATIDETLAPLRMVKRLVDRVIFPALPEPKVKLTTLLKLSGARGLGVLVGAARERGRVECPERTERPEPTDAAPDIGALGADPRGVVVVLSCIG